MFFLGWLRQFRWRWNSSPAAIGNAIASLAPVLLLCLKASTLYRYTVLDSGDPWKCQALLNHGHWLDPPQSGASTLLQNWQPSGCMMHDYQAKDISACLPSKRIVLVGDSTIRQIFWALAKKLDVEQAKNRLTTAGKHLDMEFTGAGVNLAFIWDPLLNSTALQDELARHRPVTESKTKDKIGAGILLVGGGLWHAKHLGNASFDKFQETIHGLIPDIQPRRASSDQDLVLLSPVLEPLHEKLLAPNSLTITPTKVDKMNSYLREVSTTERAEIAWSFAAMTKDHKEAYLGDGLHLVDSVASRQADVFLNSHCNFGTALSGRYPFNRTCCSSYSPLIWTEIVLLLVIIILLPLIKMIATTENNRIDFLPSSKICHALSILGLALTYCYLADRTQTFNKHQKQFSWNNFLVMSVSVLLLGLVSIRRSEEITKSGWRSAEAPLGRPILSRDQSDEWKGWMQFMILIYHYTGASKVLPVYEVVRVLVASYLFLAGFGHTLFFYRTGDYSFRRFASVLLRLNLLSCVLPYVMRTEYMFYYFSPLVSFWFVVVYLTMRSGRSCNNSSIFFPCKLVFSAVLVTAFVKIPGILETVFLVLHHLFCINWDVKEWRFRVSLDLHIVYVGMLSGVLYVKFSTRLREVGKLPENIRKRISIRFRLLFIYALVSILAYASLIQKFPTKYAYNSWHHYISPFPVIAYILLRNSNQYLRTHYSAGFAWLGHCSMETFVLQYHIWLAGDTTGLLRTGLFDWTGSGGRREDFLLLTYLFLWMSWQVSIAVGVLTSWIIDPGKDRRDLGVEENASTRDIHKEKPDLPPSIIGHSPAQDMQPHSVVFGTDLGWLPTNSRMRPKLQSRYGLQSNSNRISRAIKDDLRVRLGLILLVLWILNLTYD